MNDDEKSRRNRANRLLLTCAAFLFLGLLFLGYQPPMMPVATSAFAEAVTITFPALVVAVVLLVALRVGMSRQHPASFGWIGLALAVVLATWTVLTVLYVLKPALSLKWNIEPFLFLLVLSGTWILATSATLYVHGRQQSSPIEKYTELQKSMLKSVIQHWQVAVGVAYLYLSTIGFLYEAALYAQLGLPVSLYVNPADFAFAIVNHPIVAIVVALLGLVAFVLITWLRVLVRGMARSEDTWKEIRAGCAVGLQRIGVRVLEIPARWARALGTALGVVALVAVVGLPLVGSLLWAHDRIEDFPIGRLTLAQPARYADGVRHAASTPKSMIAVVRACDPQDMDERGDGDTRPGRRAGPGAVGAAARGDVGWIDHLAKVIFGFTIPLKSSERSAMVIPWAGVASFEAETDASRHDDTGRDSPEKTDRPSGDGASQQECFRGWQPVVPGSPASPVLHTEYSEKGQTWSQDPTGRARYVRFRTGSSDWQPRAGTLFAGEPNEKGDWVSLQYSADRRTWDEGLPNNIARYARFRVGGKGDWQPPYGFLLGNESEEPTSTATIYGVSFPVPPYRLTRHPANQLAVRTTLPYLHPPGCEVTVVGCASEDGFFEREADGRIVLNRPGEDQPDGSNDVSGNLDSVYWDLAPTVVNCTGAQACSAALDSVNRTLNCGLANLRGLAVAAEIVADTEWRGWLPQITRHDLGVDPSLNSVLSPKTPSKKIGPNSRLLAALCVAGEQADQPIRISRPSPAVGTAASVLFRAASSSLESGHTCWKGGFRHNRAALIRVSSGSADVPSCLTPNRTRLARW